MLIVRISAQIEWSYYIILFMDLARSLKKWKKLLVKFRLNKFKKFSSLQFSLSWGQFIASTTFDKSLCKFVFFDRQFDIISPYQNCTKMWTEVVTLGSYWLTPGVWCAQYIYNTLEWYLASTEVSLYCLVCKSPSGSRTATLQPT